MLTYEKLEANADVVIAPLDADPDSDMSITIYVFTESWNSALNTERRRETLRAQLTRMFSAQQCYHQVINGKHQFYIVS